MAKVVKIKQSDISKIVDSIVNEQQTEFYEPDMVRDIQQQKELELRLAKDDFGNFYLLDNSGKVYISGK